MLVLALVPLACGLSGPLTFDHPPREQALIADILLCGFPESHLFEDPSGRGHIGMMQVGQRVPLELRAGRRD